MKNGIQKMNIKNKYKEIKKDIIDNLSEVFDRENYYTHKYRGTELDDINVAIDTESTHDKIVQIYLKNKDGYIKDVITVKHIKDYNSVIETNLELNETE
jgi:hypothetical protein